ncbi:MAG: hypothetical protein ILA26_08775 [Methanobrevibacter sp.]|uniref:hypothetical protein n=1 Tax=Methanobrevibacter sp. TaxID=66852 RepID=UPI001B671AA1|nr:hypothetical protein [Methanobrevibacter sp.]MBP3792109.1 hypothetical protein [Methanobrevibacter sp.]
MISLRKINTLMVIIIIILLLNHAVLSVLHLFGIIGYSPSFQITGRRIFYPIVVHIIISLYLYFKDRSKRGNRYSGLIKDTTQQLVTGILIVVFVSLHILSYMFAPLNSGYDFWMRIFHFAVDNLLFISLILHLSVSIPKFMMSLGFLDGKDEYANFKHKNNCVLLIILIMLILAEIVYNLGGVL